MSDVVREFVPCTSLFFLLLLLFFFFFFKVQEAILIYLCKSGSWQTSSDSVLVEQQRMSLIETSTSIPLAMGLNMEHITIQAKIDQVNISEEMSRTALWKSIVHNESSSNLISSSGDEPRSSVKQRSVLALPFCTSACLSCFHSNCLAVIRHNSHLAFHSGLCCCVCVTSFEC